MNLSPNTLFDDRYLLKEMKGRGTFGEVWLATDEQLDIDIALKVYIALDDRGVADFKSEYKTTFGLNHPNLLHANHFALCEKRPYLVMPYCPSSSTNYIGNIDEPTLWRFIRDVSAGLEYLHSVEIVHHDIKPDNILIDTEGNFLITDFGISKKMRSTLRRNSARQVEDQSVGGSFSYMGPEMFSRQPESVKATDIWALGATLYELCEGELPFFGQGGGMQLNGAAIPELQGDYSDDLKRIVQMCLAKETWDRPQASQLREYAQSKLDGEPTGGFVDDKPAPKPQEESVPIDKQGNTGSASVYGTISENDTIQPQRPQKQPEAKKSKRGVWIAVIVAVVVIAAALVVFLLPDSSEKKLAYENIGLYESRVEECQAHIIDGDYGKYEILITAQDELEQIKNLEDAGQRYYPDTYNLYSSLKSQLDKKMQAVALKYADYAAGYIQIAPDMAVKNYDIVKELYPDYTSLVYEDFISSYQKGE